MFTDLQAYQANVDALIDALKSLPRAEGIDEIRNTSEPEARVRQQRLREGIPAPGRHGAQSAAGGCRDIGVDDAGVAG